MNKIREMMKKRKNNKGFSLVELIVVIAIMVVLVAVLGSTILGYIERSRYARDIQGLDSINTALSTYVAEGGADISDSTLSAVITADTDGVIMGILAEVFNADGTFNSSSNAFDGLTTAEVHVNIENGAVSIWVGVDENSDEDPYMVGSFFGTDGEPASAAPAETPSSSETPSV